MKLLDLKGNEIKDKEVVFEKVLKDLLVVSDVVHCSSSEWVNVMHLGSSDGYGNDVFKAWDNDINEFILYFGKLKDKEKFKIGVWYTNKYGSIVNYQGGNSGCGVCGGEWFDNELWGFIEIPEVWKESTEEKVRNMLTKEIEKRGYKEGVKINSLLSTRVLTLDTSQLEFDEDGDVFMGDNIVFSNGKFAEIIEEQEELIINGEIWVKK